ncbi:glucan endo-1,6-beta-glucosidase [Lentinula edodes]|uniref:glucan endo-1,6-beta-glucosidase n=1 Tax=Lentinula edodes TaxID=5353 RepID=UPI001E8D6587|nr:glucan endo-1,6-beta-glucosidase [Lentinula edodes]KAH7872628.1 glucan endo-1,6-beta-glucosidase [Lentinula edodes]KAJ3900948.1 glucan endo-1,6-beta-glucosidase [Lentinula edodes]
MHSSCLSFLLLFVGPVASQQIWDIWQTTWDRSGLFTSLAPSTPINFVSPGAIGSADIVVDDSSVFQTVYGFGGSLTDSAAELLNNLKTTNSNNYWALLDYLFSPTDGANAAGLNYIRVPLGASDFSASVYNYDETSGDTSFNNFNINAAPSYVFSVLQDIKSVNSYLKIHVLPWSPVRFLSFEATLVLTLVKPGWMKTSGSMDGGSLSSNEVTFYATYLFKSLQGFQSKGLTPYAISIQNEPQNSDTTYPSCTMSVAVEAQIGMALRSMMNNNGFGAVKIIGFDHNWSGVSTYAIPLLQAAPNSFAGVAFHCYEGTVSEQAAFQTAFPNKEIYFTECTGSLGSDWWSDIKWYMDNIFIGALSYGASTGLMWNLALDGNGNPFLPGSDSCGGGCRGIVQINSDGTYSVNQEFYSMAQASKAIIPKDVGGPFGQRIGVTIGGELSWALIVGAYVTGRVNPTDWLRYSIVVLNWDDTNNGSWDPVAVPTTIEFRGMQASYTFPVGVTTLWWFAPETSLNSTNAESYALYSETDGKQQPLHFFQ